MKTTTVGMIGTGATLTLAQYNERIAAIAGTLTALYMLMKCGDWIHGKITAWRQRKK